MVNGWVQTGLAGIGGLHFEVDGGAFQFTNLIRSTLTGTFFGEGTR